MNDIYKYLEEEIKYCVNISQEAMQNKLERFWTPCSDEYEMLSKKIDSEELRKAFSLIINDLLLLQMHSLLVAIDGGSWISEKYRFDIVDKETEVVVNEKWALHEQFFDYMWDARDGDPFRNL